MASYSNFDTKNEYGDSVTNYTARDFASIKQNLTKSSSLILVSAAAFKVMSL